MDLRLFKFGGASVRDADNIRKIGEIVGKYGENKLILVISAMGKTTNALEEVHKAMQSGEEAARERLDEIVLNHVQCAEELGLKKEELESRLKLFVENAFESLKKFKNLSSACIYDQLVSLGELFSTALISLFLEQEGFQAKWMDVRTIIQTDDNFRDATVDFVSTQKEVDSVLVPLFDKADVIITQGFLGRAQNGMTVTLGREGSDYTAAILAYCLDVKELSIWKDVPGVLTADPRRFENVEKIDKMSYKEAIEMSYYGAQVIHPKTIRPLQNKGIRLHVKSFMDPDAEGTIISEDGLLNYPPIVVIQEDVVLMQISSRDFSFIAENHLSQIFNVLNRHRIKLCTMRNSAISFTICVRNPGKLELEKLEQELSEEFLLDLFKGLQLYTFRYANDQLIKKLIKNKVVLFEERMKHTIQLVAGPALGLREKN